MSVSHQHVNAIKNSPPSPIMQTVDAIKNSPPAPAIAKSLAKLRTRKMTIGEGNAVLGRPDLRAGRNAFEQMQLDVIYARESTLVEEAWQAQRAQARAEYEDMAAQRHALHARVGTIPDLLDKRLLELAPLVAEYRDALAEHMRMGERLEYLRGAFALDDLRPGGSSVPAPDAQHILGRAVRRLVESGAFASAPQAKK